jgi:peptide/nickel transport system permease protein
MNEYSTQADWDRLTAAMGLDKPYYQQFGIFLRDALSGNFGTSIKEQRPAMQIIAERLPATLQLGLAAFAFSVLLGFPLGVLSAVKRGGILDISGKLVALIGQSAPVFWLGLMLMFFFAVRLEWLPPYGRQEATSIILPAVALGWFYAAANLRLLRSSMLNVLDSEFVKLARAKGVSTQAVIWKHSLRNALVPVLTFAGITLGNLVTGSIVVEQVFAWPGLGRLAIEALVGNDYPLLQAVVIIFTLMYVMAALLVDIMYAYIDPRIRYA